MCACERVFGGVRAQGRAGVGSGEACAPIENEPLKPQHRLQQHAIGQNSQHRVRVFALV
jgi:hypothetical protein